MKRKFIQISYSEMPQDNEGTGTILALCDDGTLWWRVDPWKDGHSWHKLDISDIQETGEETCEK